FVTRTAHYIDGVQYEENITISSTTSIILVLQFVHTSEEYFDFVKISIYYYLDHLGSIRVSYFNNGTGAEVLEENSYFLGK
ncbi:hypothetical protein, partial [uncultured Chryseobacterium sp.]|uniref:hypothetical protein n=1 Tax=uncultured Chryseobacterium sp. TaxID=259322 RepID=UPI0025E0A06F